MTTGKIKRPRGAPLPKRAVKLSEGSKRARLTAARLAAVQAIYQMEKNSQKAAEVLKDFSDNRIGYELDGDVMVPADADLLSGIVTGFEARREDVESMLAGALGAEKAGKIELLIKTTLYAGICELLVFPGTDAGIIINDYLNVTHAFYEEGGEAKIVNAVLDKLAKTLRQ